MKKIIVRILLGVIGLAILLAVGYFFLIGYLMQKNKNEVAERRKNNPYKAQEAQMFREMAEGKAETQAQGLPPELKAEMNQHMKDVKNLNEAWDFIELGNASVKKSNFDLAAQQYQHAYDIGSSQRHVSGSKLAYVLQKLDKSQEAIDLLDGMIARRETNDVGIHKAEGLKKILLESIKKQQEASQQGKSVDEAK